MCSRRRSSFFLAALVCLTSPGFAAKAAPPSSGPPADLPYRVEVNHGGQKAPFTLYFPADWAPSQRQYRNVTELVGPVEPEVNGKKPRRATVLAGTEEHKSAAAAVERLRQLASQFGNAEIEYVEIGGWPALYTTREAALQRPGEGKQNGAKYGTYLVTSVAIAADTTVVRLRAEIPSKNRAMIATIRQMAKELALPKRGDVAAAESKLEELRARPRNEPTRLPRPEAGVPDATSLFQPSNGGPQQVRVSEIVDAEEAGAEAGQAGLVRDVETNSEMEAIASTDGKYLVVATHRTYSTSVDGGLTWTPNIINTPNDGGTDTVGYNANGDSSLGFGQSGDFIYGFIAYPNGDNTDGAGFGDVVDACTTAIVGSTDNGLTFTHRGHASYCARVDADNSCFPDQEHIAVDRFNPSGSGQDQIYNTWRNFTFDDDDDCNELGSGSVQPLITCSVDGGATFNNGGPAPIVSTGGPQGTLPVIVGFGDGDFPRITAGQDGFVYVTYMVGNDIQVDKFTTCANGLGYVWLAAPEVVVTGVNGVPCPVPGLDRCNDGNDLRSPTVAVDDQDASHVFVAFADNDGTGVENVYVADSTDGGENWSSPVAVNSGFATRRYMPWVTSVCGEAFVGFYDRRRSTVGDNSLTDFFVGRAHRDPVSGLIKGLERRVSPTADSQCGPPNDPDLWCAPRSAADSESCSQQPQLAGNCYNTTTDASQSIACDFSDCGGANTNITFPSATCQCVASGTDNIQCQTGGGCPKYGDYNGIASAAGRVMAVYASATPPGGPQDPGGDIDSFIEVTNVCAPQLSIPGDVDFNAGDCDAGGTSEGTLNICNTGKADLEIDSITSSDPQFSVTTPNTGYPVVISPDFCYPFEVVFDWDGVDQTPDTNLTIVSNDTVNSPFVFAVSASLAEAGLPNIVTTVAPSGNFGDVCIGSHGDLELTIQNSGACPLVVTAVTSDNAEFTRGTISALPLTIAAGDSVMVPIRFTPVGATGAESANITIASNDPDDASHVVPLAGNSPAAVATVFLANSGYFGNVCSGDFHDLDVTVTNTGTCPLNASDIALSGTDAGEWDDPASFTGVVLEPQNVFHFPLRFSPDDFTPPSIRNASVDVTWVTLGSTDTPTVTQTAITGDVPPPDINVPAATAVQEFGNNICADDIVEKTIDVCDVGLCTLHVDSAVLYDNATDLGTCDDFTIVANPFPSDVSHDFCMGIVVRYTPTEEGEHTCILRITSNDPDEPTVDVTLHGTTPDNNAGIDIPPSVAFNPEVISSVDVCESKKPFTINNNGACPIDIHNVFVETDPEEYSLEALPSFIVPLQPGHTLGDGDLRLIFAPDPPVQRANQGVVQVEWEDDAITEHITETEVPVCGESTLTGARVLVRNGGSNFGTVERISIQRVVGNRNRRPQLDTVSVWQDVPLHNINQPDPCVDFSYHVEFGGASNLVQLVPGYYQVTATIRVGGHRRTKTVAFSVDACDFNPSVIVDF